MYHPSAEEPPPSPPTHDEQHEAEDLHHLPQQPAQGQPIQEQPYSVHPSQAPTMQTAPQQTINYYDAATRYHYLPPSMPPLGPVVAVQPQHAPGDASNHAMPPTQATAARPASLEHGSLPTMNEPVWTSATTQEVYMAVEPPRPRHPTTNYHHPHHHPHATMPTTVGDELLVDHTVATTAEASTPAFLGPMTNPPIVGHLEGTSRRSTHAAKPHAQRPSRRPRRGRPSKTSPQDASKEEDRGDKLSTADATYVFKIHEMLEDAEKEGHTHIVSWQPHGRAFRIHHETAFVEQIMPRYFKAKIGSFRRWLRAWGFVRMTEGRDRGAWYHRYFIRGVTTLSKELTRQQMAHAMVNWPPAGQVPNFYGITLGSTLLDERSRAKATGESNSEEASSPVPANQNNLPLVKNPRRLRGKVLEDVRQLLEDAAIEGNTHIVGWMPHGRAFHIANKRLFQHIIMPRYFKTSKLAHLSDTLRIWGFQRLKTPGPDKGCYYHKYFVRGDPAQTRHLSRVQMKNAMAEWPPPGGEPDLYKPQPPLEPAPAPKVPTAATTEGVAIPADPSTAVTVAPPGEAKAVFLQPNPTMPAMFGAMDSTALDNLPVPTSVVEGSQPFPPATAEAVPPEYSTVLPATLVHANTGNNAPPLADGQNPAQVGKELGQQQDEAAGTNRESGTYVLRLHEMLEDAEKDGFQHIVSWQPHGRAFRIHKEKEFIETVMPRYFKAKMGSFLRWCRAWGFVRMTEGRDRGAWYHRYFVRGVTHLSRNMSRQQMLKAMVDWLPAGHVPNFYASGMGAVLSETRHEPIASPPHVTCKNPRRLRGTVPEDLRQMLDDALREGNSKIVSWLSHGKAFKIHDKHRFTELILPRYFKASKYTYFSDALRIWGFHRLKNGRDKGAYFHRNFIKDQPHLTRHLTRIQMKERMTPWPPPEGEPDLYATPPPAAETATPATVPILTAGTLTAL